RVTVGYHGSIDIDPQSADVLAATVIPTDVSKEMPCDIRTRMKYERTTLNASEFPIPEAASKQYIDSNGWYFSNWIQYTGCRQYSAESTLTFGVDGRDPSADKQKLQAPAAMPVRGATLELRLATKVDSGLSSAGDRVEARLVRAIHANDGSAIP